VRVPHRLARSTTSASVLATADPKLKAEVYAELGVNVSYNHERRVVHVETRPKNACATGRVGEGITPISTPTGWATEWAA
jgi:hypothetical protein